MTVTLRYAVRSDIGLLREGNEDSAYAGPHLLAVADGMGGHAAGEVASAAAISALIPLDSDTTGIDMLQALADAVAAATETLRQITADDPGTEGMGTTLTALLWAGDQVAICHIGDSRAYLLRAGELVQITHDHTLVQSMVDEGRLTAEAATTHPQRSLVMRALQSSGLSDPDLEIFQARAGDRYLLCSDGLSDVVTQDTLCKTLTECTDLDEAAEQLIDLAIRSGGPDNISCVLADVLDADAGALPAGRQAAVQAGAVADGAPAGDLASQAGRADSPAARAHLLTRASLQQAAADTDDQAGPGGHDDDAGQAPGRRLPVVRSVLVILALAIAAGGFGTWRYAQDSWYVGADGGRVALFRGVSQPVAGIRLSSLYQRTDLALSAIPDASMVRATITASNLHQARQIVLRIRHDYQCRLARTAVSRWVTQQAAASQREGQRQAQGKKRTRPPKQGSTRQLAKPQPPGGSGPLRPPSVARPVVPAFCPVIIGASG